MNNLRLLEEKWMSLFDKLHAVPSLDAQIAGPFLSVPSTKCLILYVGKATGKDWYKAECNAAPMAARIKERHERTRNFLRQDAPTYNSGFWQFARNLNEEIANQRQVRLTNSDPFQYTTWTNICKIGTLEGNPTADLQKRQSGLAVETLRQEIEVYKPKLICFVTWNFAWHLVKEVFGDASDESWDCTLDRQRLWSRAATKDMPAALLLGHPQGKAKAFTKMWLDKALELLPC